MIIGKGNKNRWQRIQEEEDKRNMMHSTKKEIESKLIQYQKRDRFRQLIMIIGKGNKNRWQRIQEEEDKRNMMHSAKKEIESKLFQYQTEKFSEVSQSKAHNNKTYENLNNNKNVISF